MGFSLALSGGGCRGAAHIGALLALEEHNLLPSAISGTSAGALVAGLFCVYENSNKLIEICRKIQKDGKKLLDFNFFELSILPLQLALSQNISASAILKGKKFYSLLNYYMGNTMLEDIKLPIFICASDLSSGCTIAFSNKQPKISPPLVKWAGNTLLKDAVYSSCCLPTIFPPLKSDVGVLVDGGVSNNLPVDLLLAAGNKTVVAIDVSKDYSPVTSDGILSIATHSLSMMSARLDDCIVRGEKLLIKPKLPKNAGVLAFEYMAECVIAGYNETIDLIEVIKELNR